MILRSFAVRAVGGAMPREGNFTAKVVEFFGLAPRPDGFVILTLCDEPVRPPGLILPTVASGSAPRWDFFVRVDGEEPPPLRRIRNLVDEKGGYMQARPLGGVALGDGVAFVFVLPHDAPEGTEFVNVIG